MNARTNQPAFEVHPRSALRLRVGAGRHISSVAGTAWVTMDGDLRDIILEPGDSHAFERPAHVMVQALGGVMGLEKVFLAYRRSRRTVQHHARHLFVDDRGVHWNDI